VKPLAFEWLLLWLYPYIWSLWRSLQIEIRAKKKWRYQDSNPQPSDYNASTLSPILRSLAWENSKPLAIYVRPRHWLASQMTLNLFYKPPAKPPAVEASREAKLNYLKSLENLEASLGALFLYFKPLRSLLLIKASLVTLTIYLKPPGKPQVFKGFPSDFNHLFEAPSEAMVKIS